MGKKTSKVRVKKNPKHKTFAKGIRVRRRARDIDQIQDDIAAVEGNPALAHREEDLDLPGLGQHYCLCCARYFIDEPTLLKHNRSKVHKKRSAPAPPALPAPQRPAVRLD